MIWGVEASQLPSLCLMGKVHCCPSPQTGAQLTPVLPPRPWPSCVLYTVFRGAKPSSLHRNYVPCKTAASLIFYSPALEACGTLAEKPALLVPRENTARLLWGHLAPLFTPPVAAIANKQVSKARFKFPAQEGFCCCHWDTFPNPGDFILWNLQDSSQTSPFYFYLITQLKPLHPFKM